MEYQHQRSLEELQAANEILSRALESTAEKLHESKKRVKELEGQKDGAIKFIDCVFDFSTPVESYKEDIIQTLIDQTSEINRLREALEYEKNSESEITRTYQREVNDLSAFIAYYFCDDDGHSRSLNTPAGTYFIKVTAYEKVELTTPEGVTYFLHMKGRGNV